MLLVLLMNVCVCVCVLLVVCVYISCVGECKSTKNWLECICLVLLHTPTSCYVQIAVQMFQSYCSDFCSDDFEIQFRCVFIYVQIVLCFCSDFQI